MRIHWHREDLRLADNAALGDPSDPFVGLFVFDPAICAYAGPPRLAFIHEAVEALRSAYRERGGTLIVAHGDPRTVVPEIANEYWADRVTWTRGYSGLARDRDDAVREGLADRSVAHEAIDDALCHEPGTIRTNAGDPYQVFTYFARKWHDRPVDAPYSRPAPDQFAEVDDERSMPTLSDLGEDAVEVDLPPATPTAARDRLDRFCSEPIFSYRMDRDSPAREGTSRLSPYLAHGLVGPRTVYRATERARDSAPDEEAADNVHEFQDQLAWREFYRHVLYFSPSVVTENFKSYDNPIEWRSAPADLAAWKAGETGYPIVDAGMRQLRDEAYMHNRVRMIVAAFLTKDLLIDWREGYRWFREHLLDHDTANDSGGWQWAASTGTDAQPYFRIFNPTSQCEQYDPDGEYVREYVPELRDVATETIHEWPDLDQGTRDRVAPGYPDPIVDHAAARERALATFERARGDD
ncbi:MAG: deoxyribodipyrimidine photo-lyase [Halococcoides sp.]